MIEIKRNKSIIILAVVGGLLIFFHFLGFLRPVENFLLSLTKPLAGRLYKLGVNARWSSSGEHESYESLQARFTVLQAELAAQVVADSKCQEVVDENRKLRATLNFLDSGNFRAVEAAIIAREESTAENNRNLLINRGAKDGLRVGLGVVNEDGAIVGQVKEVKDTTAQICLTTASDCRLAAAIQNSDKTQGITDGDLGLTIKMNYIPQLEKISVGDIVMSSGLGGGIPRGLVIGRIAQVINESNDVWQAATIEPLVDFNDLTVVSVIIP